MPSDAKRRGRERKKKRKNRERKKWWDPRKEGDLKGLQEWRVGGEIWRGMQNGGGFGGPAGVEFLHLTSKFWSRGPYGGPHWRCSYITLNSCTTVCH
jgi:hypothetical protein